MTFKPEELKEILSIFKAESEDHIARLNECLLQIEKGEARPDIVEEIFREAHSLKGSARMIGFEAVEHLAHALEDVFGAARKGEMALEKPVFDVLFAGVDALSRATGEWLASAGTAKIDIDAELAAIRGLRGKKTEEGGGTPAPPGQPADRPAPAVESPAAVAKPADGRGGGGKKPARKKQAQKKPAGTAAVEETERPRETDAGAGSPAAGEAVTLKVEETIRVTTQKLDDLMNQIGEILVTKIKFDQRMTELRRIESLFEEFFRDWSALVRGGGLFSAGNGDSLPEGPREFISSSGRRLAEIGEQLAGLTASFSDDSLRMSLVTEELQESINRVRMLPLSALFNLYPRLLRDIARAEGKEVEFIIEGGQTHLDKKIVEELKDPLTHLLRNSLDHGLETPEERTAGGKKTQGTIRLSAVQRANGVTIEISDDGRGMDTGRITSVALRRGYVSEAELEEMSPAQVLSLVFLPGLSTKGIITDISGRGVGLDVVLTNIERLKGTIGITSEPGRGTTFSIKLPLTLATAEALLVRAAGETYAIPLTAVESICEIGLKGIMSVESREAVMVCGTPTSLVHLRELLGVPGGAVSLEKDEMKPAVIIGSTDDRVAVVVDGLVGEQDIVIKGLGPQLRRVKNISGATIMGDGSVVLILNPFDLIKASQKASGLWVSEERRLEEKRLRRTAVLVVDDSVTTRMLEKNILEGNGYEVTLAVDGVDALEKVKRGAFDMVVADVEMPRMNGFELIESLRREEKYRDMPLILVTSLDSEEDRRRGIEVGADAYITKGAFEQGTLLATIRQLL